MSHKIGTIGEKIAVHYLQSRGYVIHERNFRISGSEVDIIATKDDRLVGIEVKTSLNRLSEGPELAVNRLKYARIILGLHMYAHINKIEQSLQVDVVSVILQGVRLKKLKHFKNIQF